MIRAFAQSLAAALILTLSVVVLLSWHAERRADARCRRWQHRYTTDATGRRRCARCLETEP